MISSFKALGISFHFLWNYRISFEKILFQGFFTCEFILVALRSLSLPLYGSYHFDQCILAFCLLCLGLFCLELLDQGRCFPLHVGGTSQILVLPPTILHLISFLLWHSYDADATPLTTIISIILLFKVFFLFFLFVIDDVQHLISRSLLRFCFFQFAEAY